MPSAILRLLVLFLASGCSTDEPSAMSPSGGSGGSNPTGGSGPTSGSGAAPAGSVRIVPSPEGWVQDGEPPGTLGVQGAWYPYGDKYGAAKCTTVGLHEPDECSTITSPDPLIPGFPNVGGVLCTTGETAVVLPCKSGVPLCPPGTPDYSNMWGAGIGLDLNATGATDAGPGTKLPYDPDAHGVAGVAFELSEVPLAKLRVEFPMLLPDGTSTEDHPDGSPYWDASDDYPPSPVTTGRNEVRWADVRSPRTNYEFDRTKILSVQFHVPAVTSGSERAPYSFCINYFELLTE
ncbi:MAG TPA: hypothetical protein VFZ53_20900 [Polyangiaceae bacterium]